jgi:phage-related tail fiber protein
MSTLEIGQFDSPNRVKIDGISNTIDSVISAEGIIPAGAIMWISGSVSAPLGYLKANGATVSRTTYAKLFSAIGTTWGAGDGSTTFTLPDLRGEFIRSWDDSRGVDSGRGIATFQDQAWKSFFVTERGYGWNGGYSHGDEYSGQGIYGVNTWTGQHFTGRWSNPSAAIGWLWDSNPILPRNRSPLACIKY